MLRFGICDDDRTFAERFKKRLVKEYQENYKSEEETECVYYQNAEDVLENFHKDGVDVYFLDIEYGEVSGMDVARQLVKLRENMGIVYMTNYEYYATKAFVCRPLGFIRKSCIDEDIPLALASVNEYLEKDRKVFTFMNNMKQLTVRIGEIRYIQIYNHTMEIVLQNGKIQVRDKLSRVEPVLCRQGFVKINRSCLVNMKYINDINNTEIILYSREKLYASFEQQKNVFQSWQFYKMGYSL